VVSIWLSSIVSGLETNARQIDHARKLIDKGEARQYVADLFNVGRSTLYRALKSMKESAYEALLSE
jgi:DNA invertase Pin-like site-specific DNA recombinase